MKLISIRIQGMHNVSDKTYQFNDLNYLFGKNGSGKSTILQSIQLALLGYIPGVAKQNSAIFKNANGPTMSVQAVLNNAGEIITITRSWMQIGNTIKAGVNISPSDSYDEDFFKEILSKIELPIFNFSEFMNMSSNKLKDWFISFLPSSNQIINWKELFEDELSKKEIIVTDDKFLPTVLEGIQFAGDIGIDSVRSVNTSLKTMLSFYKSQLTKLNDTVQTLVHYDDFECDASLEGIKCRIKELMDYKNKIMDRNYKQLQYNDICNDINSQIGNLPCDETEVTNWVESKRNDEKHKELKDISEEILNIQNQINEINAEIRSKLVILESSGICPYSKSNCESIGNLIPKYKSDVEELKSKINDLSTDKQNKLKLKSEIEYDIGNIESDIYAVMNTYDAISRLRLQLSNIDVPELTLEPELDTIDKIDVEIENLNDKLVKLSANMKYDQLNEDLIKQQFVMSQNINAIKVLIELTGPNGIQNSMATEPFMKLNDKLNDLLLEVFGDRIDGSKFILSEKSNTFSFGITRNGTYIPFDLLSSGEKCIYTIALMLCIIKNSGSILKLILIDDLLDHLDDDSIKSLFESLYNMQEDIQLVVAGVKDFNSEIKSKIKVDVQ